MFLNEIKKSSGQVAKIILVVAIIVLIALGVAFFAMRKTQKAPAKTPVATTPPPPVYDLTIDTVRFLSISAIEEGNTLLGKLSKNPRWQGDLTTTERFIRITVGAQNVGKTDTFKGEWDLMKVIDSEGRIYDAIDASNWITEQNSCSVALKPSFQPVFCIRYYEVARVAKGLKMQVRYKGKTDLLDLKSAAVAPVN